MQYKKTPKKIIIFLMFFLAGYCFLKINAYICGEIFGGKIPLKISGKYRGIVCFIDKKRKNATFYP
jgi:hypothetical protein